jgi:integrase
MKGVYKLRPPYPKYSATWDVSPLLKYLEKMDISNLKGLSLKCIGLLALSTGQRVQTISALNLSFMSMLEDRAIFHIREVLKCSRPGKAQNVTVIKYDKAEALCPLRHLSLYIEKTKGLRTDNKLFIALHSPHMAISAQTASRWLNKLLKEAGINYQFKAHSFRHASTSKAFSKTVPIDCILKVAGWAKEKTFASFYRRDILDHQSSFSKAILDE